ncbi:hypothetical protein C8A00DRAFT_16121 [Chaetomidium leptoderma]|uniref:Geranylgeranyl pyrophosphate synthetase n=1 Tax=Chaetomidium leptoderma TaxID=669021 RepID=A0AAN6VJT9_9PEZI|nr:hypothetical protein C8A00DRAFT_16121 [Chaetomidium leptoderma]
MASRWSNKSQPWSGKRTMEGSVEALPSPPFGDLIQTLKVDGLEGESKKLRDLAHIHNPRTVTSYSWVEKTAFGPTILIPGQPPLWTPETNPSRLQQDSGSYLRDKNAARYPSYPTEPAVVASLAADPAIPTEVDIFACGSTLGNLLRFVRGQDRTFRMLAYKVCNTIFLVRRERSPTELIPDVRGYGHTFPEANTTWEHGVKGSASHQRLIRYNFGGLDLVVRFEADGYIKPPSSPKRATPARAASPSSVCELTFSMSATSVSPSLPVSSAPATTLKVTPAGTLTPQTTLFDLKTRSIYTRYKKDHVTEELPRLWVSQIPTFVLAFHDHGLFKREDTEVKDIRDDVSQWEKEHAGELADLAALLHWIRDVLLRQSGSRIEICRSGEGVLEVRRVMGDVREVLSDGVREQWERASNEGKAEENGRNEEIVGSKGIDNEGGNGGGILEWEEGDGDFTACSEECGYCGTCTR